MILHHILEMQKKKTIGNNDFWRIFNNFCCCCLKICKYLIKKVKLKKFCGYKRTILIIIINNNQHHQQDQHKSKVKSSLKCKKYKFHLKWLFVNIESAMWDKRAAKKKVQHCRKKWHLHLLHLKAIEDDKLE